MPSLDLDSYISRLFNRELLEPHVIQELCERTKEVLLDEGNVRSVKAPVVVVGDVHGQFYDVLEIFRITGEPPHTNYIFLGDYVDRGYYSIETISLLTCLKLRYPQRITLIDSEVYLPPTLETLEQPLLTTTTPEIPHEGPMADLVWSDPVPHHPPNSTSTLPSNADDKSTDFSLSPRGAGYLFGPIVTSQFLHTSALSHLTRAHQLCMEGYQILFDDLVSTVWSAPNYCYRAGNLASVMEVGEGGARFFNVFGPCPEDERDVPNPTGGGGGGLVGGRRDWDEGVEEAGGGGGGSAFEDVRGRGGMKKRRGGGGSGGFYAVMGRGRGRGLRDPLSFDDEMEGMDSGESMEQQDSGRFGGSG
ncbi:putative serine/threonine protein phosphatase, partial [Chytridiales sp. JEL 0842]